MLVKGTNDELDVVSIELAIARNRCQQVPTASNLDLPALRGTARLRVHKSTSSHIEQSVKVKLEWVGLLPSMAQEPSLNESMSTINWVVDACMLTV